MGTEEKIVTVTDNNPDVTTTNGGGRAGQWEEIFDLNTPTGVVYKLQPAGMLRDSDGLRLRLFLADSGDDDLPNNATIRLAAQGPTREDTTQIGAERTLRQFNTADQYDADQVYTIDIQKEYVFNEDAHLLIEMDSATAVDWSNSSIEFEVVRES